MEEPAKIEEKPVNLSKAQKLAQRISLPVALAGATGIALLSVIISTWLYVGSGASTLDLSRPGYERERAEVKLPTEGDKIFDSSGPITTQALDEFLTDYNKRIKEIDGYTTFADPTLGDVDLFLAPGPNGTAEPAQ